MAIQTYIHPFQYGAQSPMAVDFKTYAIRQRLPAWRVCQDPKPPFILEGLTNWNCARCDGQPAFQLPTLGTDKFQFQFQYDDTVNEDVMNPVFGWQESGTPAGEHYMAARVLDCNCDAVEGMDFVDLIASDWGVAYDADSGSLQWIEIDIGLLPPELCCFILQVEQYIFNPEGDPVLDQTITAGPFYRADLAQCGPCDEETILITGTWKKIDCWGRRYDVGFGPDDTLFTDSVQLLGNVVYLGSENEFLQDGEIEIKVRKRDKYRLELDGMPPIIAQWLATLLSSNQTLTIGDYTIDRSKGDTVGGMSKEFKEVEMFHTTIEFSIVCEIQNFGCE